MLKIILNRHVIYVLMGMSVIVGVTAKVVVGVTLRRLVVAAGGMGKSNHPLMRLVRAKFEHTCMISEKVENVSVFVDKYLYEYRVAGIRFHAWRRLEMAGAAFCLILGGTGAAISYRMKGMTEQMVVLGGTGVALALVVFLVHMLTDEEYRIDAVRNYMVDYLENIYQHRYEKNNRKENYTETEAVNQEVQETGMTGKMETAGQAADRYDHVVYSGENSTESGETDSLIWAMYKTEPLQVEDERKVTTPTPLKRDEKNETSQKSEKAEKMEKPKESDDRKAQDEAGRNQRIREILEEFMA